MWKSQYVSQNTQAFSHSRTKEQGCLWPDTSKKAWFSAAWQFFRIGSTWEVPNGMASDRLWLFKISALTLALGSPDRIWRRLQLSGSSVMLLTAAGLRAEISWNNYFRITADILFGDKGSIISLIFFFFFLRWEVIWRQSSHGQLREIPEQNQRTGLGFFFFSLLLFQ